MLAALSIKDSSVLNISRNVDFSSFCRQKYPLFHHLFSHRFLLWSHADLGLDFHQDLADDISGGGCQSRISCDDAF